MLLCAIMDSSAMPALSVYCSPEGSVLTAPLHNVGNCLLQQDLASIGTECEINLAMISLICLEWHLPQVRGAFVSLSNVSQHVLAHNSCWVPWCCYITNANSRGYFLPSLIFHMFFRLHSATSVFVYCNVKVEQSTYNALQSIYQGCNSCLMASMTFAKPPFLL